MPGCPCTFCHLQFPTNEALSLHLSNSPSCGEKLHAAWADFRLHVSTNPGLAPLEHNDQGNPMEIAYNVNDISNPNGGDCTYDILVDVDLPPTPPGRLPEMPTNPQSGPQWPRFIHPYPAPVATVVGEGDSLFDAVHKEQEVQGNNPAAPFDSDEEWDLAKWLIKNVSQTGIEEFTKLAIVSDSSIALMMST